LEGNAVQMESAVHATRDLLGLQINSELINSARLSLQFRFPRGYDFAVKNTPDIDWQHDKEHTTRVQTQKKHALVLERKVDDLLFTIAIRWQGSAEIKQNSAHEFEIVPALNDKKPFALTVEYLEQDAKKSRDLRFTRIATSAR